MCRISVEGSRGSLTLVDCAGSERKEDSMYHTKEQREEGAQINASLHALKECVRMRAAKLVRGGGVRTSDSNVPSSPGSLRRLPHQHCQA